MNDSSVSVVDVLRAARELIANVGWCQGSYCLTDTEGKTCAYCASGAIEAAQQISFGEGFTQQPRCILLDIIDQSNYSGIDNIVSWNDDPLRTKEEVLGAFDAAIEKASDE